MVNIYVITNTINGKRYVGATTGLVKRRVQHHFRTAKSKRDSPLYEAINLYGVENFTWNMLSTVSFEEAAVEETRYISKYDSIENGYNLINGGGGLGTTRLISEEDVAYIVDLYVKEGMTVHEIKMYLNTSRSVISDRLREAGVELKRGRKSLEEEHIVVNKDGINTSYSAAADFIDYLLAEGIPATKERRSVIAGVNNVLKGRRKSYLGYKIRYKNQIED